MSHNKAKRHIARMLCDYVAVFRWFMLNSSKSWSLVFVMNFYENLTNNLYNFFTCLPEHVERWDATVDKTLPDINLVLSLAESFVDLNQSGNMFANMMNENPELVHVQQRTLTTISMNLEETMTKIRKNQDNLYSVVEDLQTKLEAIEKAAHKVPDIDSAGKFYNIPRLNRLREYAEDATKFYQTLYLQIDTAMSNVDYRELLSIKDVLKTWDQKASAHPHIREILAFVTFANQQSAA